MRLPRFTSKNQKSIFSLYHERMPYALDIRIDRSAASTLTEQICFGILAAIRSGALAPGARLPSWQAWLQVTGADPERLNVHGGAIALGHPLGASGTKLMTTLVHALGQRGKRYGLQTMCEGGGMANVTIVERL